MTDKQIYEPAFPALPISRDFNGELLYQAKGLTIRDYFAAKVLQGVLASDNLKTVNFLKIASDSYAMADAMLKAREL